MGKLFSDIYGQKNAVSILSAQLTSGNLSHGYLFLGNEGTGKGYLAFEFAKYILCEKHTEDDCDNCRKFIQGNHPDFIFIEGKDGIKIDTVREAIERVNLSPNLSKFKVLMITRAENLGIEAANALLKTLEEPPADCIILMTAISEKSLPETILSRTQKIKLTPLAAKDIQKILLKDLSEADVADVIEYSEGSVGEARKILENEGYKEEKKALFSDVETMFVSKSVIEKFKIIEKHDKEKNLKNFFDIFSGITDKKLADCIAETAETEESESLEQSRLSTIQRKVIKIYADLDYNISLRLALEGLVLEELSYD